MSQKDLLKDLSRFATFPCKPNSKIPATEHGFKDAKFGQDVQEMIEAGYNAGLALSMSNLIAIDCDVDLDRGLNGLETLAKLEETLGKLPRTLTQRTPRGGAHFIFSSKGITNPRGKIGKSIDVKHKGYIMLTPSNVNGTNYEFTDGADDDGFVFAELPKSWLDYLNKDNSIIVEKSQTSTKLAQNRKIYTTIDIDKMFSNCAFLRHCRDNADVLSEPEWFSFVSILAQIDGSDCLIHSLSEPYPKYSYTETQKKIDNARKFGYPQSCKYISENYPEICKDCSYLANKEEA